MPNIGVDLNEKKILGCQVVQVRIPEVYNVMSVGDDDDVVAELEAVMLDKIENRRR